MRILLIGEKYIQKRELQSVLDRLDMDGVHVATLREDDYDFRFEKWYLSFDVVICPWRFCLLELAFARVGMPKHPRLVLATGAYINPDESNDEHIADDVIEARDLNQLFGYWVMFYDDIMPAFPPDKHPVARQNLAKLLPSALQALMLGQVSEHSGDPAPLSRRAVIGYLDYLARDRHGSPPGWARRPEKSAYPLALNHFENLRREHMARMNQMVVQPIFPAYQADQAPKLDTCFMLMPFTDDLTSVYRDIIRPTMEENGIRIQRGDDFFTHGSVMGDVWKRINLADFLIADLTGRNPNVFYELGIAHTLGKPVILLSQSIDDIPFDIRHQRVIVYGTRYDDVQRMRDALTLSIAQLRAEFGEAGNS
jgi:hypothetical protein